MLTAKDHIDNYGFLSIDNKGWGDSTWLSSWFYLSALLTWQNPKWRQAVKDHDPEWDKHLALFLDSFARLCFYEGKVWTHPCRKLHYSWEEVQKNPKLGLYTTNHFTRDQMAPLLALLAAVAVYKKNTAAYWSGHRIIKRFYKFCVGHQMSDHPRKGGMIMPSNVAVINEVARLYGLEGSKLLGPSVLLAEYKTYSPLWYAHDKLPAWLQKTTAKGLPRPYTFFNAIAHTTAFAISRGRDHADVRALRSCFSYPAKHWYPGYKVVAGAKYNKNDFERFNRINSNWKLDILHNHCDGSILKKGKSKVLDYLLCHGLKVVYG